MHHITQQGRQITEQNSHIAAQDKRIASDAQAIQWRDAKIADITFELAHEQPGVVYDFCLGRGGKYPSAFLKNWSGTLVVDGYAGYDDLLSQPGRTTAHCLAHARRKFDELHKANASEVAAQAIQRIAWLYRIESEIQHLDCAQRLQIRQQRSQLLWDELHTWLQLERTRVP